MKNLVRLASLALVFLCFAFSAPGVKKTVVIDAGHGGDDFGTSHNALSEKHLVQCIATKIKTMAASDRFDIVLLRDGDYDMSLAQRVEKINQLNPDLVISLHVNFSINRNENGISAIVSKNNRHYSSSVEKAEHILNAMSGQKLVRKEVKDASLFMLNKVSCPALLLEMGYLTNAHDRQYLSSEEGQNAIALQILNALHR